MQLKVRRLKVNHRIQYCRRAVVGFVLAARCGIFVPLPGMEPAPHAWNLNPWTAREVPGVVDLDKTSKLQRKLMLETKA